METSDHKSEHKTTTSTYEQLRALYCDSGRDEGALQEDVAHYLRVGYVFAAPGYFLMGRRIRNGWYIHAAVGPGALEKFLHLMPYPLDYIGWERRGGTTRWYRTDKLIRKIRHNEAR